MLAPALARALEAPSAAQAVQKALQVVAVEVGAAEDQRLLRPAPPLLPGLQGCAQQGAGLLQTQGCQCLGGACDELAAMLTTPTCP